MAASVSRTTLSAICSGSLYWTGNFGKARGLSGKDPKINGGCIFSLGEIPGRYFDRVKTAATAGERAFTGSGCSLYRS